MLREHQDDPTTDILTRLPAGAREKLIDLRDQRDAEIAALRAIEAQARALSELELDYEKQKALLQSRSALGAAALVPEHDRVKGLDRKREAVAAERARLQELADVRSARWSSIGHIVRRAETYCEEVIAADLVLKPHSIGTSRSRRGWLAGANDVERCRKESAKLRAERRAVIAAPKPSAWCKQQARHWVQELATRGAISVFGLIERGEPLKLPETLQRAMVAQPNTAVHVSVVDTGGLLASLFGDALIAHLEKQIDLRADDEHALTDAQREAELERLDAALLASERDEEAAIVASEGKTLRRPEADSRAVLGLADELPPPSR